MQVSTYNSRIVALHVGRTLQHIAKVLSYYYAYDVTLSLAKLDNPLAGRTRPGE